MGWWPFRKKGRDFPPEVERIFGKLRRFLDDETAQNDALPDSYRGRLLANPPCDYVANTIGDFGRTVKNPIPVNGPIGELLYLSGLVVPHAVPAHDVPAAFHRLGSQGNVDVFEVVSEDGRAWDVLYLSPYFPRKSRALPNGYQRISHTRRGSLIRGTTSFVTGFPANIYDAAAECTNRLLGISIADPELKSLERSLLTKPQRHITALQQLEFSGRHTFNQAARDEVREVTDTNSALLDFFDRIFALVKRTTEQSAKELGVAIGPNFDHELSYVLLYLFSATLFLSKPRHDPNQVADRLAKSCLSRLATREGVTVDVLVRNYRDRFDRFRNIDLFVTQDRFLANEGALTLGEIVVVPPNMAFGAIFMSIVAASRDPLRDHLASL